MFIDKQQNSLFCRADKDWSFTSGFYRGTELTTEVPDVIFNEMSRTKLKFETLTTKNMMMAALLESCRYVLIARLEERQKYAKKISLT